MKLFIIALLGLMLFGCLHCPACPSCPPEKAYSFDIFSFGRFLVETPKGFYDERNNWYTEDEWKDLKNSKDEEQKESESDPIHL